MKMGIEIKECEACRGIFRSGGLKPRRKRFCSRSCYLMVWEIGNKKCRNCNLLFNHKSLRKRIFCSRECSNRFNVTKRKKQEKLNCISCTRSFNRSPSHVSGINFCSNNCYFKWCKLNAPKSKNHWNWRGGITPVNVLIRNCGEYKSWRISVFRRDFFTCVFCGYNGKHIEADHIKPFSIFPELRFDINNGRTLCRNCHIEVTRKYKNTLAIR